MNLRHIEIFHAVYTSGSVSAAARQLNISQPAVTNLLRHAETLLGFNLFDRVRGRLVPTREAHELYSQAEAINDQVQAFRQTANNIGAGRHGVLRIATLPSLGMELVPPVLARFLSFNPGVMIELHTLHHADVVARLMAREADIVICYSVLQGLPIVAQKLGTGEMVAYASRAIMPPGEGRLPLTDLANLPFISTADSGPQGRAVGSVLRSLRAQPHYVAASRTYFAAAAMANAGMGITVIDQHTAFAMQRPGMTIRLLEPSHSYEIQAVHLEAYPPSRIAGAFLDALGAGLSDHNRNIWAGSASIYA